MVSKQPRVDAEPQMLVVVIKRGDDRRMVSIHPQVHEMGAGTINPLERPIPS